MRSSPRAYVAGLTVALAVAACGTDAPSTVDAAQESTSSPVVEATEDETPESEAPTAANPSAAETTPAEELSSEPADAGDSPQEYFSSVEIGELPELPTADGVEIVLRGAPDSNAGTIPLVVYNGSEGPISRIEVSGKAVDGNGETVGQGSSQGFFPAYVPPGEHTYGYVYVDATGLPDDVELADPAVDYEEGVSDFENIVPIDVVDPEQVGTSIVGEVANPHEIEITGPVSVDVACLSDEGDLLSVSGSYAERDDIAAGETSTFGIDFYDEDFSCPASVIAASGYSNDF